MNRNRSSEVGVAILILVEGILLSVEVLLYLLVWMFVNVNAGGLDKIPNLHQREVHPNSDISPHAIVAASKDDVCSNSTPVLPLLRRYLSSEERYLTSFQDHGVSTRKMWSEPTCSATLVRGLKYMQDSQKIPAGQSLGQLVHVDIWRETTLRSARQDHIALLEQTRPNSIITYFQQHHPNDYLFILNFQVSNYSYRTESFHVI